MTKERITRKLHNPKAHSPAVYIPCWLIQVPSQKMSHAAKILYGRLAQWSNELGQVFRSAPQLSQELGTSVRNIERYLKELRDINLIGTSQPQPGGLNHFQFFDHEWMHDPINENLTYKQDNPNPPSEVSGPPVKSVGTPPSKVADININKIKRNKDNNNIGEKVKFSVVEMLEDNPNNIPQEHIENWLMNRGKHKVTKLVWQRINKNLAQLSKQGIGALDAFDRMVTAGWRSLELEYFNQQINTNGKITKTSQWDVDSVWNA